MEKRYSILNCIIIFVFLIVIIKLFDVQVLKKDHYVSYVNSISSNILYSDSTARGKIYDRNGVLIVDNELVRLISYLKFPGVTTSYEIELAYKLAKSIDFDYSSLADNDLKKFYMLCRNISSNKTITDSDLSVFGDIDFEAAYVYSLMNSGYSYASKCLKRGIDDREYAFIVESDFKGISVSNDWKRRYEYSAFRTLIGNISSIPYENKNYYLSRGYSLNDRVGVSYLENIYEEELKGLKAKYKNDGGMMLLVENGNKGSDLYLTIDIKLQEYLEELVSSELLKTKKDYGAKYFNKLFVVITDPRDGSILAMTGKMLAKLNGKYVVYDYSPGVFTNAYAVGSVVKGASHIVGYSNGGLEIGEVRDDSCLKLGSISKCSWAYLGRINDITALKLSSNTYQFRTAIRVGNGSLDNGVISVDNNTLDIYRSTFNSFGLGVKTGIEFNNEAVGYKGNSNLPGFLLDFSIGQYDTYTPLQLAQYIGTVATGKRFGLHLKKSEPVLLNEVGVDKKYLERVQLGLKEVVSSGLGYGYIYYKGAGKTGTSETFVDSNSDGVIDTETVTTAFVGYFPYDDPMFAFSIVAPDVSISKGYQSNVTKRISAQISKKLFDLYKNNAIIW